MTAPAWPRTRSPFAVVRAVVLLVLVGGCTPTPSTSPSVTEPSVTLVPTPVPTTTAWVKVASMHDPRWGHSATLLADGRVLVAGGIDPAMGPADDPAALTTVELYDPATNSWTVGPPMLHGRRSHVAVRLADGRVLLYGGFMQLETDRSPNPFAEIFDPTTNTWSNAAPSLFVGGRQPAFVLDDGRVLVMGQPFGSYTVPPLELVTFDPSTGTWITLATGDAMRETLESMAPGASVLLDPPRIADDSTLALRLADRRILTWSEHVARMFDPATNTWADAARPPAGPIGYDAVVLPDGRVLFTDDPTCTQTPPVIYDPAGDRWSAAGLLPNSFRTTSTLLPDGRVLIAGGGPQCAADGTPLAPTTDALVLDPTAFH